MRIAFLGSPDLVVPVLKGLVGQATERGHEVVGVVSQPARPVGRKRVLTDPPVAIAAKELGLPCLQPEKARDEAFLSTFTAWNCDIAITAAYGQILTEKFLAIPKRATINIHPSLLPQYRGAIPVPAALLNGDKQTGVSILFTVKALDAGNLIEQKVFPIEPSETSGPLSARLFEASVPLVWDALGKLSDPGYVGDPQDESAVTHCSKVRKEDGQVRWDQPAREIYNRYRAYSPWPGAFTFMGDKRVVLTSMGLGDEGKRSGGGVNAPGALNFSKETNCITAGTGDGTIHIQRLKVAGSKETDAPAFWNGIKDKSHAKFS